MGDVLTVVAFVIALGPIALAVVLPLLGAWKSQPPREDVQRMEEDS